MEVAERGAERSEVNRESSSGFTSVRDGGRQVMDERG